MIAAASTSGSSSSPLESIELRPQLYARVAGAIYLLVIVFGGYSEGVVLSQLLIHGDMTATAGNIAASRGLWRFAVAGDLLVPLVAVAQLWIEYLLLRPAGRNGALLFVFLNLASLSAEIISKLFLLLVEPSLNGQACGGVCGPGVSHALADFAVLAHDASFHIALLLFGAACLVSGRLIFVSGYLPRLIGLLMQAAGLSYLVASFTELFLPSVSRQLTPWILLPPLVGESALCLWLLIRGVDLQGWRARMAGGATGS